MISKKKPLKDIAPHLEKIASVIKPLNTTDEHLSQGVKILLGLLVIILVFYFFLSPFGGVSEQKSFEEFFTSSELINLEKSDAAIHYFKGIVEAKNNKILISKNLNCSFFKSGLNEKYYEWYGDFFPEKFVPFNKNNSFLTNGSFDPDEVPNKYNKSSSDGKFYWLLTKKPNGLNSFDIFCDLGETKKITNMSLYAGKLFADHSAFEKVDFMISNENNPESFVLIDSISGSLVKPKNPYSNHKVVYSLNENFNARFIIFRPWFKTYSALQEIQVFKPNYSTGVIESKNINFTGKRVVSAVLNADDSGLKKDSVQYFLSSDGVNWVLVEKGVQHTFFFGGNELRWRAIISPENSLSSPQIENVRIYYSVK